MISVPLIKIAQSVDVDDEALPAASREFIFAYGIRQILNDAMASAKAGKDSPADEKAAARALAEKRLANLMQGAFRASPVRGGDPVRKRALELATEAVRKNPKFIAWLAEAKLKASDKAAVAKVRELATDAIAKEGNKFTAQARIDVEAAKALDEIEIEL